jgi:hypothetical protein
MARCTCSTAARAGTAAAEAISASSFCARRLRSFTGAAALALMR